MSDKSAQVITLAQYAHRRLESLVPGNITNHRLSVLTLFLKEYYKIQYFTFEVDFNNQRVVIKVQTKDGEFIGFKPKNTQILENFVTDVLKVSFSVTFG